MTARWEHFNCLMGDFSCPVNAIVGKYWNPCTLARIQLRDSFFFFFLQFLDFQQLRVINTTVFNQPECSN